MFPFCHRPEPTNFLIKNNASVSAVDKVNRNTPLHCAVLAGNVDAAHILLEAGASVEAENINVSFNKFKHFFFLFFFLHYCECIMLEYINRILFLLTFSCKRLNG